MKRWLIVLAVSLGLLAPAAAFWQSRDSNYNVAISAGVTYQGPGDVVSGASVWGSCARAYNAAYANGTNPLCDLVSSSAPTVVLCTLRVRTNGFADLSAYCSGSLTPAATCLAATGGICDISKVYDQSGNVNHFTNTTASSQPKLTFSALNGLPGIACSSSASSSITTGSNVLLTAPFSMAIVSERTATFTTSSGALSQNASGTFVFGYAASANTASFNGVSTATASDSAFHSLIGLSGSPGSITVDGSTTTGSTQGTVTAEPMRLCRSANTAVSMDGIIMEGGVWPSTITPSTMNTNQHSSANGYNF